MLEHSSDIEIDPSSRIWAEESGQVRIYPAGAISGFRRGQRFRSLTPITLVDSGGSEHQQLPSACVEFEHILDDSDVADIVGEGPIQEPLTRSEKLTFYPDY